MADRPSRRDDSGDGRGVSTVVGYVLVLGIVALLTSTLFVTFGPFVTNQQHDAVHSTLTVVGQDIAGDVESVDRLAVAAGENGTVSLRSSLPSQVGGNQYEIRIERTGSEQLSNGETVNVSEIVLRTHEPEVRASVTVRTRIALEERTGSEAVDGGPIVITYEVDGDGRKTVIENE